MKYCFLIGWLLSMLTCRAQIVLDLNQTRSLALAYNKQIAIASREKEKAVWTIREFRANYFPKIAFTGFYFYDRQKQEYSLKGGYLPTFIPDKTGKLKPNLVLSSEGKPVFKAYAYLPDIPIQLALRGVYFAGLRLEQPVFTGGKIRAGYQLAKLGDRLAYDQLELVRSEIIVEVDKAYWQGVRAQELVEVALKYRETVHSLVKHVEQAQQVGLASLNDVLKVRVKCSEAELKLQQARHGLVLAGMNLCRLIGLEVHTPLKLTAILADTLSVDVQNLSDAVEQRPDYNMLTCQVEMARKQVRVARADFLPQVGMLVGYGFSGGVQLNGNEAHGRSFSAMASVQVPIFSWGNGRNKVRIAKSNAAITLLSKEHATGMMKLEIAGNRFKIKDALTRIDLAREAVVQAEENLKVSQNQYDLGMEDISDLLEAQTQWQQAWSDWIDAKALLQLSETEYLQAIGRLKDDLARSGLNAWE